MISSTDAYWTPLYARHFARAGHEVRVLSLTPDPLAAPDVDVVRVCGSRPARVPLVAWFLAQVPRVWWLLRRYAPDVVFATYMSSNGTVAALAWRGPLVVSGHGGDVLPQLGRVPGGAWLHRRLMRFQCSRAGAVHVVADELVDRLAGYGIPRERIARIPLGVDVEQFDSQGVADPSQVPHIVCTRRQEPVYANHVLVDALALLRDRGCNARCTFVGGGPLLEERRAQVRARGLEERVTFTGQIPIDAVRAILRSAHIYVSASTTDGTSSSLLEAMLCGAFPVVSRIRGNRPWIRDGVTGLTFEAGDAGELADAMERAIGEPKLRADAAAHNRDLVRREGNLGRNMERVLALLEQARSVRSSEVRQGTVWRMKTSKKGPVGVGAEVGRPVGEGGDSARIGIRTTPPS